MKKEDEYNYFENISWIILVVILLLAIGYYVYMSRLASYTGFSGFSGYSGYTSETHGNRLHPNGKIASHSLYHDINKHNSLTNSQDLSMAPPKLVNLYDEDYKVIRNKNDIECVNKDSILLYDTTYKSDNESFDVELMRPYMKNNKFLEELEDVYNTRISSRDSNDIDNDELYESSLRQQKTDLPLANIPVYALLDNKSLKLSDRSQQESK